ncbi:MAG: hypothetical protein LJE62_03335 [Silicimonas sp.]|nr:hypothetical protein [Silicimonas sp.]
MGPAIGAIWTLFVAVAACGLIGFFTGQALRPAVVPCMVFGAWLGFVWMPDGKRTRSVRIAWSAGLALLPAAAFLFLQPAIYGSAETDRTVLALTWVCFSIAAAWPLEWMLRPLPFGAVDGGVLENVLRRLLSGLVYVFFVFIFASLLFVMVSRAL